MKYVIERASMAANRNVEFYVGFAEGRPLWSGTRNRKTQFDAEQAERIAGQLRGLGFVVEVRPLRERKARL